MFAQTTIFVLKFMQIPNLDLDYVIHEVRCQVEISRELEANNTSAAFCLFAWGFSAASVFTAFRLGNLISKVDHIPILKPNSFETLYSEIWLSENAGKLKIV